MSGESVKEFKNYIDGKWVSSGSGRTFASHSPANGELVGTLQLSNAQDVQDAVDAADRAFEKWRKYPAPKRAELIYKVSDILRARKQEMGELLTREMGKVLPEALGDVQEAIDMAAYMAGEGRRLNGLLVPSELPSKWGMAVRDPLGVVAAITPWNFPIAIPAWKMFPALVCGNTVRAHAGDIRSCRLSAGRRQSHHRLGRRHRRWLGRSSKGSLDYVHRLYGDRPRRGHQRRAAPQTRLA